MLIYRVEDIHKEGLHRGSYYYKYCRFLKIDAGILRKQTPPQYDPHMGFRTWYMQHNTSELPSDYRFAFESVEHVRRWIPSKKGRAFLKSQGLMLMVYETNPYTTQIGDTQLVFLMSKSFPVHCICLEDTKTILFTLS